MLGDYSTAMGLQLRWQRLKANIISLGATLSKLLQIDGKTYTMKKDGTTAIKQLQIGLLAQGAGLYSNASGTTSVFPIADGYRN